MYVDKRRGLCIILSGTLEEFNALVRIAKAQKAPKAVLIAEEADVAILESHNWRIDDKYKVMVCLNE